MYPRIMKIKVPDLKKISEAEEPHNPGYGLRISGEFYRQNILEQGSTPEDEKLLMKLGIKKNEKILSIASYYASWTSFIKKLGPIVYYSDISSSMVKWAKEKYGDLFRRYIVSSYELIPKKEKEYDWTVTFEACGGKKGLGIAYLRSLLNNKGGILVLLIRKDKPKKMGNKFKQYPLIVSTLARMYKCRYSIKIQEIKSRRKGHKSSVLEHQICKILTNERARKKAKRDLEILDYVQDKEEIIIKNKYELDSIKRLNGLAKIISDKLTKEIEVK